MSKEIKSEYKPKVVISTNLAAQIGFLHAMCPTSTEWSGLLIWKLEKGGLDDLSNIKIRAEAVFPMDYGDSTFTSFEGDENWIKCFEKFPQIDPVKREEGWYVSKIHSHHGMSVFHSPTDKNDLHETAPKLPMFLSLIVNYKCETDCELAIAMDVEESLTSKTKYKMKGWSEAKEKEENTTKAEKATYVMKCDVYYEQDEWMLEQCEYLSKKPKQRTIPGILITDSSKDKHKNQTTSFVRKFVRDRATDSFTDLVSLGESWNMPLKDVLEKVNDAVDVQSREDYKKALKTYFMDYWYHTEFYTMTDVDEEEVLDAILQLISLQTGWIASVIKETVNELKAECTELREV